MAPDVFQYHDYRQYLRDLLAFFKSSRSGPSLRLLATKVKVKAPYLSYVLSGKRPLSEKTREKLMKILKLDSDQKAYFRLLTVISDTENIRERENAFRELQKFRQYRQLNPNETEVYRYLTAWYYPAIREMVQLPGFKLDAKWIQKNLVHPVSRDEITRAVDFLVRYGFIIPHPDGSATLPSKRLECTEGVYKVALGSFHRQLFNFAAESIERFSREERHILGQMLPLPARAIPQVAQILDECLKKISELSDKEAGTDAIYHLGFFSFPIAKVAHEE